MGGFDSKLVRLVEINGKMSNRWIGYTSTLFHSSQKRGGQLRKSNPYHPVAIMFIWLVAQTTTVLEYDWICPVAWTTPIRGAEYVNIRYVSTSKAGNLHPIACAHQEWKRDFQRRTAGLTKGSPKIYSATWFHHYRDCCVTQMQHEKSWHHNCIGIGLDG